MEQSLITITSTVDRVPHKTQLTATVDIAPPESSKIQLLGMQLKHHAAAFHTLVREGGGGN